MQDKEKDILNSSKYLRFYITTASMYPALQVGDIVIVRKTSLREIKKGDIITFNAKNKTTKLTHRVIGVKKGEGILKLHTKGDSAISEDSCPVTEDSLEGKVIAVIRKNSIIEVGTRGQRRKACVSENLQLLKKLKHQLSDQIRKLVFIIFFGLLVSLTAAFLPYLSKPMIDIGYGDKNIKMVLIIAALATAAFILNAVLKSTFQFLSSRLQQKLLFEFDQAYIQKLYFLPVSYFTTTSTGEQLYRLNSNASALSGLIASKFPKLLTVASKTLFYLMLAFAINFKLALLLVLFLPLFIWRSAYFRRKGLAEYKRSVYLSQGVSKKMQDVLSKIYLMKALGAEEHERRNYADLLRRKVQLNLKIASLRVLNTLTSTFLSRAALTILGLVGMLLVIKEVMTLGSLTAFIAYCGLFLSATMSLTNSIENISKDSVHVSRYFEIMDMDAGAKEKAGAKYIYPFKGKIEFQDVSFGYDKDKLILENFNMQIQPGSWVLIKGTSGCGKTTLLKLILRFYDPKKGKVLIDDIDIQDIKVRSLRDNIAIAIQDVMLLNESVRDNITYGLSNKTLEDIRDVARAACIDSFIQTLPDGYDTMVGENGACLSKGQKQRICLARALIRNPKILILDEALSSVDIATEKSIYENLKLNRKGFTTIVVAQKSSFTEYSDVVYKVDSLFSDRVSVTAGLSNIPR